MAEGIKTVGYCRICHLRLGSLEGYCLSCLTEVIWDLSDEAKHRVLEMLRQALKYH